MPRFLLYLLAALLLLVAAAVIYLTVLLDREQVVALAAGAIREQTGATLTVDGDLDLSFWPALGIAVTEAAITMPGREAPDLELGRARIGVQLAPLLSRRVEIDSIAVSGLVARLQSAPPEKPTDTGGFSDAELDAWYAERRRAREAAGSAAGAEAALAVPLALQVSKLDLRDARIEVADAAGGDTSVIELTRLEASGLNLDGRPIPLELALRVPGEQVIEIDAQGAITVRQQSDTVGIEGLAVTVRGATTRPLALAAEGSADLSRQTADLQLELDLGEARGGGRLRYAAFESPQIDADLALDRLDPALFALAGPRSATAADAPAGGDEPLPLDTLRAVDTRAALRVERAIFGAHTVENLALKLRALEGVVDIAQLTGTLHGGQLDARATLDGKHNTARLDTRGGLDGVDLGQLLAATGTAAVLTGTASLDWELSGSGRTTNELIESLAGPVTLDTRAVVLQGTSVEKLVCQAVALTNNERLSATFAPDTRFETLAADVQVAGGNAALRPLRAELAHVELAGNGNFDLLEQDFEATFKARLLPSLEELDPACRVSKRLTAIDFPVDCRGNVDGEPADWCRVDTEAIVRDLAVNEGRRRIEKEAGKLFEKFLGGKNKGEQ